MRPIDIFTDGHGIARLKLLMTQHLSRGAREAAAGWADATWYLCRVTTDAVEHCTHALRRVLVVIPWRFVYVNTTYDGRTKAYIPDRRHQHAQQNGAISDWVIITLAVSIQAPSEGVVVPKYAIARTNRNAQASARLEPRTLQIRFVHGAKAGSPAVRVSGVLRSTEAGVAAYHSPGRAVQYS